MTSRTSKKCSSIHQPPPTPPGLVIPFSLENSVQATFSGRPAERKKWPSLKEWPTGHPDEYTNIFDLPFYFLSSSKIRDRSYVFHNNFRCFRLPATWFAADNHARILATLFHTTVSMIRYCKNMSRIFEQFSIWKTLGRQILKTNNFPHTSANRSITPPPKWNTT